MSLKLFLYGNYKYGNREKGNHVDIGLLKKEVASLSNVKLNLMSHYSITIKSTLTKSRKIGLAYRLDLKDCFL